MNLVSLIVYIMIFGHLGMEIIIVLIYFGINYQNLKLKTEAFASVFYKSFFKKWFHFSWILILSVGL